MTELRVILDYFGGVGALLVVGGVIMFLLNKMRNGSKLDNVHGGLYEQLKEQLIAAQALEKPSYIAPLFLTYPVQQSGNGGAGGAPGDRTIKTAIKRLARDIAGAVDLGAIYQWPCDADRIHPTTDSYVKRGEAVGRAMRPGQRPSRVSLLLDKHSRCSCRFLGIGPGTMPSPAQAT
jgi:hypothetical protein